MPDFTREIEKEYVTAMIASLWWRIAIHLFFDNVDHVLLL